MVITSCVQGLRSSVSCAVKWAVTEDLDSCYELRGYSRRGWESIRVWGQVKTSVCVWHFWTPPWNIAAPEMLMMAYMLGFLVPDGCTWQGTCVPGEHSQTAAADDVHRCAH